MNTTLVLIGFAIGLVGFLTFVTILRLVRKRHRYVEQMCLSEFRRAPYYKTTYYQTARELWSWLRLRNHEGHLAISFSGAASALDRLATRRELYRVESGTPPKKYYHLSEFAPGDPVAHDATRGG